MTAPPPPSRTLAVSPEISVPLSEVELRASRPSGPGGQHANVTASRVEAIFDVAASRALSAEHKRRLVERHGPRVTAVAQEARGQARNREMALERLREKLARALAAPKPRRRTRRPRAAAERRLAEKRIRSQRKRERRRPPPDDRG